MTDALHVCPVDDLREHEVNGTGDCWCNPFDDDGIWVHRSLDGREAYPGGGNENFPWAVIEWQKD